ncbi:hypothetical protein M422DRAFT_250424 [Sphaerobolus stellatus SS14]|uniref:Uncharacterized protein n=1 Tax=Sphaerobolus stellatus (strain SS14) TaxID=990650 RepID=A0A0C9W2W4_SPHS4|nr:hypothetical protein M422DRAFT_250424 [Sphaerobolus stellatus SS14]
MDNYSLTGRWDKLGIFSSLATVKKDSSNQRITITVDSIDKTGSWTAPYNVLQNASLFVDGTLYYKKLSDIGKEKFANYNDDRIVFHENDYTGRDFVSFIPIKALRILSLHSHHLFEHQAPSPAVQIAVRLDIISSSANRLHLASIMGLRTRSGLQSWVSLFLHRRGTRPGLFTVFRDNFMPLDVQFLHYGSLPPTSLSTVHPSPAIQTVKDGRAPRRYISPSANRLHV